MNLLSDITIIDFTAPTLLGVTVLLLLFGRIVPRVTLKDKSEEAERWRIAYETEREARSISDAQTAELLEMAKTSNVLLKALFDNTTPRESGAGDAISQ